jgi:hypothetical protein
MNPSLSILQKAKINMWVYSNQIVEGTISSYVPVVGGKKDLAYKPESSSCSYL